MKIEFKNKEAEKRFQFLFTYNCKLSIHQLLKMIKREFGEDCVVVSRLTPTEWVQHYEQLLKENIEADAPKLIIDDLKKKLEYWCRIEEKRRKN